MRAERAAFGDACALLPVACRRDPLQEPGPSHIPVDPVAGLFPTPADRYLRTLSEAVAADSVAAVATRDDVVGVADRQGVSVVVAAQAVLEDTCTWPAVSGFRLLNYLKAGLVDVSVAAHYGWQAEPLCRGDQDLHILTLRPETGRLLASATLRRPPLSASARMADHDRPLLLVEEAFGIGVYDCSTGRRFGGRCPPSPRREADSADAGPMTGNRRAARHAAQLARPVTGEAK